MSDGVRFEIGDKSEKLYFSIFDLTTNRSHYPVKFCRMADKLQEYALDIHSNLLDANSYPTEPVEDNLIKSIDFSAEDADLLLRIGMCEAGGEDVECIASVMCVVLNRAWSDSFPNSVYDYMIKLYTHRYSHFENEIKAYMQHN